MKNSRRDSNSVDVLTKMLYLGASFKFSNLYNRKIQMPPEFENRPRLLTAGNIEGAETPQEDDERLRLLVITDDETKDGELDSQEDVLKPVLLSNEIKVEDLQTTFLIDRPYLPMIEEFEIEKKGKRKEPKPSTKFKLYSLARNQCSFPTCTTELAATDKKHLNSNICHIEAASPGGPRYNPNMTEDERRDYPNLIILCKIHHDETNDEEKYSVSGLKQMRSDHETEMFRRLSAEGILTKHPSSLVEVINLISSQNFFRDGRQKEIKRSFIIDEKISYNNIIRFKPVIEEYRVYQGKLNRIYREIEEHGSYKKEHLLQNIKGFYLEAKGKMLLDKGTIEEVRRNADNLIIGVQDKLIDLVYNRSSNLKEGTSLEAINVAVSVIVVDAFMRCKILEEPRYDRE